MNPQTELAEATRQLTQAFQDSNSALAFAEGQMRTLRYSTIAQEAKIEALREEVEALGREIAPIGALLDTVKLMASELSDVRAKLATLNK